MSGPARMRPGLTAHLPILLGVKRIPGADRMPANPIRPRLADANPMRPGVLKRKVARLTGLEPATPGVTGRYSNQLSYNRA